MNDLFIDQWGIFGTYLHYALIIFLVGSAFMVFLYLWKKGKLNFDEGPKYQMMQDDEEKSHDK